MSGDVGERTGVVRRRCLPATGQRHSPSELSLLCELHPSDRKFLSTYLLTDKIYAVESRGI